MDYMQFGVVNSFKSKSDEHTDCISHENTHFLFLMFCHLTKCINFVHGNYISHSKFMEL
jgi:hypothetical protein